MLQDVAPGVIVPELRPYRSRGELSTWAKDPTVIPFLEDLLAKRKYVAIGEFHIYGADADLPNMRRVVELAKKYGLFLHSHSDADAVDRHFQQDPERQGAVGPFRLRAAGERARDAAQVSQAVVRSRLPDLACLERQGDAGLARGLPRISRPLPGRHRYLHARAAGTTSPSMRAGRGRGWPTCRATSPRRSPTRTASDCSADRRNEILAASVRASVCERRLGRLPARSRARHRLGGLLRSLHARLSARSDADRGRPAVRPADQCLHQVATARPSWWRSTPRCRSTSTA